MNANPRARERHSFRLEANATNAFLLLGLVLSFVLASAIMSGWKGALTPNLDHPFVYAGDALSHLWLAQRASEGWIFANSRSGFPFGSSFLDYPGSDSGNLLILKLLGRLLGNYYSAANLYFLLSFPATFAATFVVCKKLDLRNDSSFACALLFTLLPFHFARLLMGHLFYTWYFVVPIYFYIGYRCLKLQPLASSYSGLIGMVLMLIGLSSFGVYFAFFGLILISIFALMGAIAHRTLAAFKAPLVAGAAIAFGVGLNVLPNILHRWKNGVNPEVAQRVPAETEVYSLKLTHLVMPHLQHRLDVLRDFAAQYTTTFPLSNTVSYVGVVGVVGLFLILFHALQMAAGRPVEQTQRSITVATLLMLLISTVGGFNVLFALLVSPTIRAWDRMGVFVGFFLLLAAFVKLDRFLSARQVPTAPAALLVGLVLVVGVWDQTARFGENEAMSGQARFESDKAFVAGIEAMMPRGASILQMPYISFPESAPVHRMHSYDQLVGFLNSRELRWSGGGMAGRAGDKFYRQLFASPLPAQVETARALGFAGLYVDKRGYADGGVEVIDSLTRLLNKPATLTRSDGEVVFFSLI